MSRKVTRAEIVDYQTYTDQRDEVRADITRFFLDAAKEQFTEASDEEVIWTVVQRAAHIFLETDLGVEGRNLKSAAEQCNRKFTLGVSAFDLSKMEPAALADHLTRRVEEAVINRKREIGPRNFHWSARAIMLQTIDTKWMDHLYGMDALRHGVSLRGYAGAEPIVEYKKEGYRLFSSMITSIEDAVTDMILKVKFRLDEGTESVWNVDSYIHEDATGMALRQQEAIEASKQGEAKPRPVQVTRVPGRNDPCPCGAKDPDGKPKKYKKCCGAKS